MTVDAAKGRKTADDRQENRRLRPVSALAGALVAAAALAPLTATEAVAQSRSGIYINNDVLNNLGPGPEAAPFAPLAPSGQPTYQAPGYQVPTYQAPVAPPAPGGGGLGFQPYGSGNFVVTRPGTLLFPPLHEPDSTLTPRHNAVTPSGGTGSAAAASAVDGVANHSGTPANSACSVGPAPSAERNRTLGRRSPGNQCSAADAFITARGGAGSSAGRCG